MKATQTRYILFHVLIETVSNAQNGCKEQFSEKLSVGNTHTDETRHRPSVIKIYKTAVNSDRLNEFEKERERKKLKRDAEEPPNLANNCVSIFTDQVLVTEIRFELFHNFASFLAKVIDNTITFFELDLEHVGQFVRQNNIGKLKNNNFKLATTVHLIRLHLRSNRRILKSRHIQLIDDCIKPISFEWIKAIINKNAQSLSILPPIYVNRYFATCFSSKLFLFCKMQLNLKTVNLEPLLLLCFHRLYRKESAPPDHTCINILIFRILIVQYILHHGGKILLGNREFLVGVAQVFRWALDNFYTTACPNYPAIRSLCHIASIRDTLKIPNVIMKYYFLLLILNPTQLSHETFLSLFSESFDDDLFAGLNDLFSCFTSFSDLFTRSD